ncbi:MAG: hypothetical protein ACLQUY_27755 [Ktedonobacterales bacterium]
MSWVVRAGIARADTLINGYRRHSGVTGLYGFSVQYAADKSIEELAQAGQFSHAQISYAQEQDLAASLTWLGYTMRLVPSPGKGYHHTFAVLYDATGLMLQALPQDVADALSRTFKQRPNPHRVR